MSGHTRAPWFLIDNSCEDGWCVIMSANEVGNIALVHKREDAVLMCAALDLKAALEDLFSCTPYGSIPLHIYNRAEAALAKAEGKS